jgi:hypothetical protein
MTDAARFSEQELSTLPRWARLALALRCIRRARLLVKASPAVLATLDQTVARIEQAVRQGSGDDELADAAAAAYTLALDNLDGRTLSPAGEEDTQVVTCMVAHAAAFAAEAATLADNRAAARLVAQAADFAIHAFRLSQHAGTAQALAAMRIDLDELRETARREGWEDTTPMPERFVAPF